MKPDAASLPPVVILASGFILLLGIAALAANPDLLRRDEPPAGPDDPARCPDAAPTPTPAAASSGPACQPRPSPGA